MGEIHIDLFSTLDHVGQAPGDPEEDPDGFPFGGWQAPMFDEAVGRDVVAGLAGMDALLLGRRTYDIFAAYWPNQESGVDSGLAMQFNSVPKYVASRGTPDLDWPGSQLLVSDLVSAVREIRERHAKVHVIGSLDLVHTLMQERLFDQLNLWVFPVVLGVGKKIFVGGEVPTNLTLSEPPITSSKGAVLLHYKPADGVPGAGDMRLEDRGV
jgi:dihydrofolate reductase